MSRYLRIVHRGMYHIFYKRIYLINSNHYFRPAVHVLHTAAPLLEEQFEVLDILDHSDVSESQSGTIYCCLLPACTAKPPSPLSL